MQFSLDHKRQSHKQNQCLISTRSIALRLWLRLRLRLCCWWKPALNDTLKQSIKICSSSPRWLWKETPKSFSSRAHRKTYKNNCMFMCCISQVLTIKQCNAKLFFHYPLPRKNAYWFWKKTIKVEPWYNRAKVGKMCSLCLSLIVSGFFSIFILLLLGLSLFYLCWRCWSNRWIQAVKFSQCRSYCCACGPVAAYYTIGWFCSVLVS